MKRAKFPGILQGVTAYLTIASLMGFAIATSFPQPSLVDLVYQPRN